MTDDISKVYLNTGAATLSPVRRVAASGAECHCQCHKNPNVVHVVPCCRLESATTPAAALPELPDPDVKGVHVDGYSVAQMEAYALAYSATLARQLAEAKADTATATRCHAITRNHLEQAEFALAAATRRVAEVEEVSELRKVAKRNLRSLIERGSSDTALMLRCLEELS